MIIFLNGTFVPEERAVVSVLDRGFLYGDGLFEAIRISQGNLFRWDQHLERLRRGVEFLRLPWPSKDLRPAALHLLQENASREGILRISLSRGVGKRGYSPRGANDPTLVMSVHPLPVSNPEPPCWRLHTTRYRVYPNDPLSQFKTCNKLPQVLARAEAEDAGADEGLLLTPDGMVAEATSGNVFWIQGGVVATPPLGQGVLPGITRSLVLELCAQLGIRVVESLLAPEGLLQVEGIFLSLTSWGVLEASHLDGRMLARSEVTEQLRMAYRTLLQAETEDKPSHK